jgi:hypothetical protein
MIWPYAAVAAVFLLGVALGYRLNQPRDLWLGPRRWPERAGRLGVVLALVAIADYSLPR